MAKSRFSGQSSKSKLGTTEEYNARLERKRRRVEGFVATNGHRPGMELTQKTQLDIIRIKMLYKERDRLNWTEGLQNEPWNKWEVDHVRTVLDNGEAEPGNLRLVRRWANGAKQREDEEVHEIRQAIIMCLFEAGWPRTIDERPSTPATSTWNLPLCQAVVKPGAAV